LHGQNGGLSRLTGRVGTTNLPFCCGGRKPHKYAINAQAMTAMTMTAITARAFIFLKQLLFAEHYIYYYI
jgi:hypothetical protein